MNMRLMPMIYLPVTLISLRRKFSSNKGMGQMIYMSFVPIFHIIV